MFICDGCHSPSEPHEPERRVVVEIRKKVYPPRIFAEDPGGSGWETVREISLCTECFKDFEASVPRIILCELDQCR